MFDFNLLVGYYKQGLLDDAREYLYDNIMALCTKELLAGIEEDHHVDMIQDIYLKIDEWILNSITKGFTNKQIYAYIKLRISGFIINYFKFEIGKNYIDTNYTSGDDGVIQETEYIIDDMVKLNNIPTLLLEGLQECTPLEMRFILLHHYMGNPVNKIEEITGYSKINIYKRIKSGMKRLKKFLESRGVNYEDLI